MTMCFGYYYSGTRLYVKLADGHSTSVVTKIWSTYNDCMISIRPYYNTGGGGVSSIGEEEPDE